MNDLDFGNIGDGLHPVPRRVSVWSQLWWDLIVPVGAAAVLVVGLLWWLVR